MPFGILYISFVICDPIKTYYLNQLTYLISIKPMAYYANINFIRL
jgi:hypothetical protein